MNTKASDPSLPAIARPPDAETTRRDAASRLGARLRRLRKVAGWTQGDLCARSGVAASTISKAENNLLSPSFETLLRLAEGLGVEMYELLGPEQHETVAKTRRVVTRKGDGEMHETPAYTYELLCTELVTRKLQPLLARLKAHSRAEFGPLLSHPGEEVIYVLEGEVELHTEHYGPVRLAAGDCAYLDSIMGHGCLSTSEQDALVFWVHTAP